MSDSTIKRHGRKHFRDGKGSLLVPPQHSLQKAKSIKIKTGENFT